MLFGVALMMPRKEKNELLEMLHELLDGVSRGSPEGPCSIRCNRARKLCLQSAEGQHVHVEDVLGTVSVAAEDLQQLTVNSNSAKWRNADVPFLDTRTSE